jgi:hypothetical protein
MGAIEGPIRIPLDSSLCLFNVLALPCISSNSFKLQPVLFSICTALRHHSVEQPITNSANLTSNSVGANPSAIWFGISDVLLLGRRNNRGTLRVPCHSPL